MPQLKQNNNKKINKMAEGRRKECVSVYFQELLNVKKIGEEQERRYVTRKEEEEEGEMPDITEIQKTFKSNEEWKSSRR